jgi:tetratricopeptide (TPR) repeat protein
MTKKEETMTTQKTLTLLSQEPGIKDLPSAACRLYFAKAILAERSGNHEEAEKYLQKAIESEEKEKGV